MFTKKISAGITAVVLVGLFMLAIGILPAMAASATNDDFDAATVIGGEPFTDTIDTSAATMGYDDPAVTCFGQDYASVWYS